MTFMTPGWLLAGLCAISLAATAQDVTPLSSSMNGRVPPPWQVITLPKIPRHTSYEVVNFDGRRVVKATADGSYANVVHPLNTDTGTAVLRWSWRVDEFPAGSDLSVKRGDDLAAKVCVLFDLPLDRLSFFDRLKIELGRRLFRLDLPAATLCYVWDRTLAPATWLPNIYTDRVRMLVLRSGVAGQQTRWFDEDRDLRDDFIRAFGPEAQGGVPRISAIAFATDADNTGSRALAYFGDITLATP
ncbi:MAG: hypothetical protein H6R02_950 [Burkholderiaceae bacterium]|jgi:hypothetical protein|nr:hypothetical protein [Burkholderiaceae bacterium]